MLVAAEPSGDALGAALAAELRRDPGLRVTGVGGPLMAAEGIDSPFDIAPLSVLGITDALRAYPMVLRRVRDTVRLAGREAPDVVVLIDSWGFNLRLARALKSMKPAPIIIKYVAPQVWATRPGRARTLAQVTDRLLTIHAFDAPWFEAAGLPVTFVGNPALQRDFSQADGAAFRRSLGIGLDQPLLLLLPGSRRGEVERLMGPFGEAVDQLRAQYPGLQVVLAAADSQTPRIRAQLASWRRSVHLVEGEATRLAAMRAATIALACSGTVTTELALAGCPIVVAYRMGALTHAVAKLLIRTPYITLFNVAAQAFIAPELVQYACTGRALAREVIRRLENPQLCADQAAGQSAALELMRGGVKNPTKAAADAVLEAARSRSPALGAGSET